MSVSGGIGAIVDVAAVQQGVILAVSDDELAQSFGFCHRLTHQALALYAASVVRKGDATRGHTRQVRQRLSPLPHRDGAVGVDTHAAGRDERQLRLQVVHAVGNGV